MSDTPRTDASIWQIEGGEMVSPKFARNLERELAAANERIRRLEEAGREVYLDSIASDHQWNTLEASHMNALREVLEAKP